MTREPKRIHIHLSNECNLNCLHCYLGDKKKISSLSIGQVSQSLSYFAKKGFKIVNFSGGEPTLSPLLAKAIDIARKLRYEEISIGTNGVYKNLFSRLPDNRLHLTFSLDGAIAKTNDYVRGEGSFRKTMRAIKRSVQMGYQTSIIYTVNKINLAEGEKVIGLADSLGIDTISFNFTSKMGNARKNRKILLTPSEWVSFRKRLNRHKPKKVKIRFPYRFVTRKEYFSNKEALPCPLNQPFVVNIFPDGSIFYCCLATEKTRYRSGFVTDNKIIFSNEVKIRREYFGSPCPIHELTQGKIKKDDNLIPVCVYHKMVINGEETNSRWGDSCANSKQKK